MLGNLGIRSKLMAIAALTLLPVLVVGGLLMASFLSQVRADHERRLESAALAQAVSRLEFLTGMAVSDAVLLSRLPALSRLTRDGLGGDETRDRLGQALAGFLEAKQVYDRAQVLDAEGKPLVELDLVQGRARPGSEAAPAGQATGGFFQEAAKLPPGRVYLEDIGLVSQGDGARDGLEPVLRFAVPVRGRDGGLLGVAVLSFQCRRLFQEAMHQPTAAPGGVWLILDDQGHYIHHSGDPSRRWGAGGGEAREPACPKDFGAACAGILAGGVTRLSWKGQDWLAFSQPVSLPQEHAPRLVVVHLHPAPSWWENYGAYGWMAAGAFLLSLAMALAVAWLGGGMVARPLTRLAATVQAFSRGDWTARSELRAQDELGSLAEGFNQTATRLRDMYGELEDKVTQRTADLETTNRELAYSADKIRAILDSTVDAIITADTHGVVQSFNRGAERIFGYQADEVVGQRLEMLQPPEVASHHREYMQRYLDTGEKRILDIPREEWARRKDGTIFPIYLAITEVRLDDDRLFTAVIRDMTQLREAEDRLKRSQRMYQALTEAAPVGIFYTDLEGKATYVNERWMGIAGLSQEEALGDGWIRSIHPADREALVKGWLDASSRRAPYSAEYRYLRPDSRTTWVYGQAVPHISEQGQMGGYVGTITDINERKLAEQDNLVLGRILEDSINEIFMFTIDTLRFTQVNRGGRENLGYTMAELRGMTPLDIKPEVTHEQFDAIIAPLKDGSQPKVEFTTVHQRKDGSTYPVQVYLQISAGEQVPVFVAIIQDITERHKAMAEIKRLSLVAQRTDNAVMISDAMGRTQWVNEAFTRITEYTPEEVMGIKPGALLQGPETDPDTVRHMHDKLARGEGFTSEVLNYTKSGRKYWLSLDVQPVRGDDGEITNFVAVETDITGRKQTELELRQQSRIIDQTHDAVVTMDTDGVITSWNQGAVRMLGFAKKEAVGQGLAMVTPGLEQDEIGRRLIAPVMEQGQQEIELELKRKDGGRFSALLSLSLLRNLEGQYQGIVGHAVDITERKRMEEAILQAKESAEAASRIKSEFLANMSHELRTPLNAIIGFSEILVDQTFGELNEKQTRQAKHILESGRHLLSVINDILDLSKVESGKMELEPNLINLGSLIHTSLILIKEKAAKHAIDLEVRISDDMASLNFTADERKLKQIMFNLLSNAAKFTPDQGSITIGASHQGGTLTISVADTGAGIAPQDQERIFEEFEQVDSTYSRRQQGTGLGLALTRRLVELHGGSIKVESPGEDQGSTFTFTIPLQPAQRPQGHPPEEPEAGDQADAADSGGTPLAKVRPGATVLVVDEDPIARELLSSYLEEGGYQVETAANAAQGLAKAQSLRPVAITLAVMLPDQNGLTLLGQLRSDPATKDIPVIIVSITDDREQGLRLGAAEFLQKPVKKDTLLGALSSLAPRGSGGFQKVLVVDDDPADLEMISTVLAQRGCPVLTAQGGAEGARMALDQRPDLIILDLNMPEVSGWEVLDALREKAGDWRPPILVYTGQTLSAQERQRLAGSVQAVVMKGGGKGDLLREMDRLTEMAFKGSA